MSRQVFWAASVLAVALPWLSACSEDAADEPTFTREQLMDPATCKECHASHYDEWSGSMHAYASTDPVFRAMNARGQRETNGDLGDFCVKCHAPLAVQEKATTNGTNMADVDDKLQGVTCYFCHQVTGRHGENNNPLDLANDTTMRGGYADPVKNKAHKSAYSPLHDSNDMKSSELCGTCHDISVPAHFSRASEDVALEKTHAEWKTSIFATGKKGKLSCGNCHFDKIEPQGGTPIADYPGVGNRPTRHGHKFPGVDVALADFPNRDDQLEAVRAVLNTSLRVQMCGDRAAGTVAVELENVAVGHNVPSGASQDRRMWVEVHVYDNADGQPDHEIFSRGVVPAGTAVTALAETESKLMLFREQGLDKDGNPAHMFWDIASVKPQPDGTIGVARGATPSDPLYHKNYELRGQLYSNLLGVTRATATIHMQPIGRDVLDDLVESKDLEAAIRDAMPTFDFLPNADVTSTIEWTASAMPNGNNGCLETARGR